jgi:dipeptidyl aminopeptidase/acylaminoacyl peptidase
MRIAPVLIRLVLLLALTSFVHADDLPYVQRKDVVFAEVHGTGLLMDIFTPRGKSNGLAIVDVVSGAWSSDRNKIRDHTLAGLYDIFCSRGYVVFAARPGSKSRYTAVEMDRHVKLAIRYAKEHAGEFKVDPQRLGLTGASAGGHLATLAALTPAEAKADARNPLERHDSTVSAVGVFFPPTDFLEWDAGKEPDLKILGPLLFLNGAEGHSAEEIKKAAKAVSPLHRVGKPTIPFLLIHGDADKVVPLSHSEKLVAAIKAAGGSAELIVKAGGGHPWLSLPEEVKVMADWFDKQLGQPVASGGAAK